MSETQNQGPSELDVLKRQADVLGVAYSNNIGVETLRERIRAKRAELDGPDEQELEDLREALKNQPPVESLMDKQIREQHALIRISYQNVNPSKQGLPGEYFTAANKFFGNVTKFVPYGDGSRAYHVEQCILTLMEEKKFNTVKFVGEGEKRRPIGVEEKEFNIFRLTPLTPAQLEALAADQRATDRLKD